MDRRQVTINDLYRKKSTRQKITMLTAYDYPTAKMLDRAGIDTALVGDSLGNTVMGLGSTTPVTMDEMIHHAKAVRRGLDYAFLIGDMPFMSYQESSTLAVRNAGRFVKEAGCDMVKLEGGREMAGRVSAIVDAGMSVCAHIGLTPQSVSKLGGYRVQGKDAESAAGLFEDAKALEEAGASMIVFECIPSALAKAITHACGMITIGIGAGPDTDGQVLVFHDLVGLSERSTPKMAKQYLNLAPMIEKAMSDYASEVSGGSFPAEEHGFSISPEVLAKLDMERP